MAEIDANPAASEWLGGLPYRLWRANQAANRRVRDAIDELGVTVTQLGITVHLDELGHMSASDLARMFGLTPQSVSTALGHLEDRGWVRRVPHPIHRRVIWYEVTAAGAEAADDGRARVGAVSDDILKEIPESARDGLFDALSAIIAKFGDESPSGTMWPLPGSSPSRRMPGTD